MRMLLEASGWLSQNMADLFDTDSTIAKHDSGGKVRIRLKPGVIGFAVFLGPNDCYRYLLERQLDQFRIAFKAVERSAGTVGFCWMNPSCAGGEWDDPTVAKGWRYASAWGYGRMLVVNAHAYCRTDQSKLSEIPDPIGPENDKYILEAAKQCDLFVIGYGTPQIKTLQQRGPEVARMLIANGIKLHVHALSKAGVPIHPRMHPEGVRPIPWGGPD